MLTHFQIQLPLEVLIAAATERYEESGPKHKPLPPNIVCEWQADDGQMYDILMEKVVILVKPPADHAAKQTQPQDMTAMELMEKQEADEKRNGLHHQAFSENAGQKRTPRRIESARIWWKTGD